MEVRPDLADTVFLELRVVKVAEERLEKEDGEDDEADDGVEVDSADLVLSLVCKQAHLETFNKLYEEPSYQTRVPEPDLLGQLDAQCGGGDVQDEAGHLNEGVDEPGEAARDDSHGDGADREDDDEGDCAQDAVDSPRVHGLLDVEANDVVEVAAPKPVAAVAIAEAVAVPIAREVPRELLGQHCGGWPFLLVRDLLCGDGRGMRNRTEGREAE